MFASLTESIRDDDCGREWLGTLTREHTLGWADIDELTGRSTARRYSCSRQTRPGPMV